MKLARIHIEDSTNPAPIYERMRFDGIRFYYCIFPKGAWQTYYYPEDIAYEDLPSCHINILGTMVEPTGTWPDQEPGWHSRDETFVIPKGLWTRWARDDHVVRWCCTGMTDGDDTREYVHTLFRTTPFVLKQGFNFLIASGRARVEEKEYEAPMRIQAKTGQLTIKPIGPINGFHWETRTAKARINRI